MSTRPADDGIPTIQFKTERDSTLADGVAVGTKVASVESQYPALCTSSVSLDSAEERRGTYVEELLKVVEVVDALAALTLDRVRRIE